MPSTDTTQKMLRTIINSQTTFRQEVFSRIDQLDKKIEGVEERLTKKIDGVENRLTKRLDSIGKQLAYLEDDSPTRKEFTALERKVS